MARIIRYKLHICYAKASKKTECTSSVATVGQELWAATDDIWRSFEDDCGYMMRLSFCLAGYTRLRGRMTLRSAYAM
jgi:hypothetical protein